MFLSEKFWIKKIKTTEVILVFSNKKNVMLKTKKGNVGILAMIFVLITTDSFSNYSAEFTNGTDTIELGIFGDPETNRFVLFEDFNSDSNIQGLVIDPKDVNKPHKIKAEFKSEWFGYKILDSTLNGFLLKLFFQK